MKIKATGITGEAFVLIQELWDLPVDEDRFVFYTLQLGNDCGFRSPCCLPERVDDPLADGACLIAAKFDAEVAADWRESALTASFKLRGRLNQRIAVKVWVLNSQVLPWETASTELKAPEGSELVAECSFMADYARGTSSEQVGWLALSPSGAASVRKLCKRKAGTLEIFSIITAGQGFPSFTADTDNLNGRATEFTSQTDSPWDGVCASGITLASLTDLLTAIVEVDIHIGRPISRYTLVLPRSLFKLTIIWLIASSAIGPNRYVSRRLLFCLVILLGHAMTGLFDPLRSGTLTILNSIGVKYEPKKRSRLILASLIMGLKDRFPVLSGMLVALIEVYAIFLRSCADICDAVHSRQVTLAELRFVALFLSPWIFTRLWNVLLHLLYAFSFAAVLRYRWPSAVLATVVSAIFLLCGKERYSMSGRPLWSLRESHQEFSSSPN